MLIDRRTGTTTPDLWPEAERPHVRDTRDIDNWLAIIAAGGGIGITPEEARDPVQRDGVVSGRCARTTPARSPST